MRLKLLVIILVTIIYSLFTTPPAFAQSATVSAGYLNANPNVPTNLHTYTQSVFIELASAISCQLSGTDPINPGSKCLGIDPKTHKIGFVEDGGGVAAVLGSMISDTFYLPISTHQYGAYLAGNFGITKQTYAQTSGGLGFNSLLPTLSMWKAFRNITYMIFTLLFIVIGLGIMFRIKIDPRTVMTLQNQIPKIIMALIFVTFSYAIAGFLIDMMYVTIYLIIGVFAQQGFDTQSAVASTPFGAVNGIGGMHDIAYGVSSSISGMVSDFFTGTLGTVVGAAIGTIIGSFLPSPGGTLGTIVKPIEMIAGGIIGGIFGTKTVGLFAGIITYLIVMIAMVSALIRLWFTLIKSYLYVFLTVVFAPFYIATGVIPGRSGIGSWMKGMIANLAVFPTVVVMFLLGSSFVSGFVTPEGSTARPFLPPLIGEFASPERMAAIIGLAVILLTPEVANMVNKALKVEDLKEGAAIGRALQAGTGVVGAPLSSIGSKLWSDNPVTKEPQNLKKWVNDRLGGGASFLSRAVSLGASGKWKSRGVALMQQRRNPGTIARINARRAARGAGPLGGPRPPAPPTPGGGGGPIPPPPTGPAGPRPPAPPTPGGSGGGATATAHGGVGPTVAVGGAGIGTGGGGTGTGGGYGGATTPPPHGGEAAAPDHGADDDDEHHGGAASELPHEAPGGKSEHNNSDKDAIDEVGNKTADILRIEREQLERTKDIEHGLAAVEDKLKDS